MRYVTHIADLAVVGGGLAGMCAAISAARHGSTVVLMQDRPVLGGNASSEIRMWLCGAHGPNNRETGLVEEIELDNIYRNPTKIYALWDSLLWEKVRSEPNITLLLNCSCNACDMDDDCITSITGWQGTAETWHTVKANYYADCSGDSILAPLTGADFRIGREARSEFNESIEPEHADTRTMGMSCLLQAREMTSPQPYVAPPWANVYESDAELPFRGHSLPDSNFWWIELGGEADSIHDTEQLRDELLKIAFGVWDHIKNRGDHHADNWALDWVGFLPGKRESRRYVGDYMVNQNDVKAGGRFDDIVAYAGWTMDDHNPAGLAYTGEPTIFHPAPSPWGIPYRSLFSRNIVNLFFAGRNISVTHAALSSSRVMKTCALLGQAAGTAAAIAAAHKLTPRGVYEKELSTLQQALMDDDCWLPGLAREMPSLTQKAALSASNGNAETLRNGHDRPIDNLDNGWLGTIGDYVEYRFPSSEYVDQCRFVFDSELNRASENHRMRCNYPLDASPHHVAQKLVKSFSVEIETKPGIWREIAHIENNHQRLVWVPVNCSTTAIKFVPRETWGAETIHLFAWDVRN